MISSSYVDSKSLDGRVSPADACLVDGRHKSKVLGAAIAIRNIGIATFFVTVLFATVAYVRQPHGKHHLPGLVHFVPGLCCQYGSTMTLTIFNKIKKRGEDEDDPSVSWRERLSLVLGFVLMTGGLVGSIYNLVLKQYSYLDYANVFQNVSVITSLAIVLVAKGLI